MSFPLSGIFAELKTKHVTRKVKANNTTPEKFIVKYCDDRTDNLKGGKLDVDKGRVLLYILEDVRNSCRDAKTPSIKTSKTVH